MPLLKKFIAAMFVCLIVLLQSMTAQITFSIDGMPAPGTPIAYAPPALQEDVLPNGLRVLYAHTSNIPLVAMNFVVDAGNITEPEGKSGVAYLTAQAIFSGTEKKDAKLLASELSLYGTSTSSVVQNQSVQFSASALKENFSQTLKIFADMLMTPAFDSSIFRDHKQKLLDDAVKPFENPSDLATRTMLVSMYGKEAPFAYPTEGRFRDLYDLTIDDVKEFYAQRYAPNNTTLVLCGDVDYAALRPLIIDRLGAWERASVEKPKAPVFAVDDFKIILLDNKTVKQPLFRIGFQCTKRSSGDFERLLVLNEVFGSDRSSRLGRAFWGKRVLTPYIVSGVSFHQNTGYFVIGGSIPAQYIDSALAVVFETIQEMKDSTITEEELYEAKKAYIDGFDTEFAASAQAMQRYQEVAVYGLPLDYYSGYVRRFVSVTADDIRSTATALFSTPYVIVVSGKASELRPELEKRYGSAVEMLTVEELIEEEQPESYEKE